MKSEISPETPGAELYILFIYNSLITPSPSSFYLVIIDDILYIVADTTF